MEKRDRRWQEFQRRMDVDESGDPEILREIAINWYTQIRADDRERERTAAAILAALIGKLDSQNMNSSALSMAIGQAAELADALGKKLEGE